MKICFALIIVFTVAQTVAAASEREENSPAKAAAASKARELPGVPASTQAVLERLRRIEQIYQEALKPGADDKVADDDYSRGWPEVFGPEAKRLQRMEKARKLADKLREDAAKDAQAARTEKKERQLDDAEFEKSRQEIQLDAERARARLEKEMMAERAKLVTQVADALKRDPDAEVKIEKDGTITIRKGKPPQPQAPVLIR